MKKCAIMKLVLLLTVFSLHAAPVVIEDTYIGGDPILEYKNGRQVENVSYDNQDVIGSEYDITAMSVDIDDPNFTVNITSTYFNGHVGQYGIELGDLFISTDGYNPNPDSELDQLGNGEIWEYGVVLDNHLGTGGDLSLYSIDPTGYYDQIVTSHVYVDEWSGWYYRSNQEVQVNTDNAQLVGSIGTWGISGNTLSFNMNNDFISGANEIGLHWTMTCGNDVIEGSVTQNVPEPGMVSLIGFSLLSFAVFKRRKK